MEQIIGGTQLLTSGLTISPHYFNIYIMYIHIHERERETPSIAHSGQGWARLKLAAWNAVKVSLVGGRDQLLYLSSSLLPPRVH